jgi:hypothetical protein
MTYTAGSLILASDYNTFATNTNAFWAAGSGSLGWGQTTLSSVSTSGVVTATNWATLVNTLATAGAQTGTSITSRTAPVTGNTISILTNLTTDITNITNAASGAVGIGAQQANWSGTTSKTTATGSGSTPWTITFTHTISWASAAAQRYFFNAGGLIRWQTSKTADATDADTEWNDLASTLVGSIYLSGSGSTKSIAGISYNGTTKIGGTGTPSILSSGTGAYNLTGSPTNLYRQFADTGPYTGQYINLSATNDGTNIVFTTVWIDDGGSAAGSSDNISGGTATTSATFGTAPATLVTVYPPSTTYLANTWGSTSVAASVA